MPIAAYPAAAAVITLVALAFAKETKGLALASPTPYRHPPNVSSGGKPIPAQTSVGRQDNQGAEPVETAFNVGGGPGK